ncbi:MAG TPA: amidohydrolase family protein [Devosia sp.]|nr:amidohydrolase family protein [Devosia sp.]
MTLQGPLVDAHFHLWMRDHPLTDTAWHAPPTDAPTDALIATLDAHNVIFGVVAAASIHGEYRDYIRHALKTHRRLRATATLSPRTDLYTMEQMKAEGFVGVRLMRSLSDTVPDLNTGEYRLFFRRVAELGWHVHLVDRADRYADSIAAVEASGARLVIDHLGHIVAPQGANHPGFKAILAAVERGNTWAKVSGRFRATSVEAGNEYAAQLLRVGGGDRCLWGSDWPFAGFEGKLTYDQVLADYYEIVPDAAMRLQIDRTALRFYFG